MEREACVCGHGFERSDFCAEIIIIIIIMPLGQSRVYRVTQLRTGSVHCRESVGTVRASEPQGSSSNGCGVSRSHHGPINMRLSFPTPTIGMKWAC